MRHPDPTVRPSPSGRGPTPAGRAIAAMVVVAAIAVAGLLALPAGRALAASDGQDYVALGDSYSSGPGLGPAREPGCGRSSINYASRIAAALGLGIERRGRWSDYSCAGATAGRAHDGGPVSVLDQIGWADHDRALGPGTRAVTFTIGGNDSWVDKPHDGLYGVLASCIRAGAPCGPGRRTGPIAQLLPEALTGLLPSGLAQLVASLLAGDDERSLWLAPDDVTAARTTAKLRPAVAAIRRRAPNATIAVVGYPQVVPRAGSPGCAGPIGLAWSLDDAEITYLDGLLAAYDQAQRAAVATLDRGAGPVRYVDLRTPSRGHDLCAGADAWVNGPILSGLSFLGDSLHPSATGMEQIAGVVASFARATGMRPVAARPTRRRAPSLATAAARRAAQHDARRRARR
ncbi:putative secreted hydrolase [Patulibacter medicamentivorans]|uniref:Putative secreted hydrolase n=1 Tax=Patulibacter medicamentivorans TaxID=1097667 RepID=H0E5H4_9ACTN|nr:SGNH/GDSL hydrolase family protein [Patulibacter medicamentivorans]EHN11071.1 putative secreted hydrolase [Patulibacter medicamentivorans]